MKHKLQFKRSDHSSRAIKINCLFADDQRGKLSDYFGGFHSFGNSITDILTRLTRIFPDSSVFRSTDTFSSGQCDFAYAFACSISEAVRTRLAICVSFLFFLSYSVNNCPWLSGFAGTNFTTANILKLDFPCLPDLAFGVVTSRRTWYESLASAPPRKSASCAILVSDISAETISRPSRKRHFVALLSYTGE